MCPVCKLIHLLHEKITQKKSEKKFKEPDINAKKIKSFESLQQLLRTFMKALLIIKNWTQTFTQFFFFNKWRRQQREQLKCGYLVQLDGDQNKGA